MPSRRELLTCLTLVAVTVAGAVAIGPRAAVGLDAKFWRNASRDGPPSSVATGSLPAIEYFLRSGPPAGLSQVSAEWTGWFTAPADGTYEFELASDDGAWLYIGQTLVVDNGGEHGRRTETGRIELTSGAHPIAVRYFQGTGDQALETYWRGPGTPRRYLRAEDVAPTEAGARLGRWRPHVRAIALAIVCLWAGLLLYVPSRVVGWWLWREVEDVAPRLVDRASLAGVLVLGFALLVWGLEWGLDAFWAADELAPGQVRELIQRRFGDGWYDKYPLMHYAVLGIPISAFEIADRVGLLAADSLWAHMAQLAVMRAVSVVMGLGAIVGTFLCAAELYGPRRATLGTLAFVLTSLFVYYGKVANLDVPFMCWFALAMLGFLRIWKTNRWRDYVLLGVAAAAAVATKDQAYASLALLPIGVIAASASHRVRAAAGGAGPGIAGWIGAAARALVDPRLIAGGLASAAAFALFHNALFNWQGVVDHFRLLSTLGDLAIVPRTPSGYWTMTTITADLFAFALGWPLLLLGLLGIANAVRHPARRWWLWLLLVPVSFHLTFTFVTLYVNDRYLYGGLFVMALFAGSAMGDLVDSRRSRLFMLAVVVPALTWSMLLAASVNVMMNLDSRQVVRRWLDAHAPEGARIGLIGSYAPSIGPGRRALPLPASIAQVRQWAPDYLVVNARYADRYDYERSPDGRDLMRALADGSLGYVEVLRQRSVLPSWALLQYDPEYRGRRESVLTNLDKINPEIVVYRRRNSSSHMGGLHPGSEISSSKPAALNSSTTSSGETP